ncbi:MAG: tetratricopeptide repeat protein, partial [Bacteroidota bacterium]
LGHLKKLLGNVREAIAAWNVVASDSVRASREVRQQALVEIGANYSALREYAAALTSFERAGTIGGARSGEAWYHAGVVAEKTKLARKASDYYARASRDSSTTVDPRARLIGAFKGAVLVENFSEALRLASRYQTQFAQDVHTPRILFEAAKIAQERIKGFRSAIDLYQEIVSGYSVSTYADDALFGLGVALAQFGEYEQALQTFESLEKRFPSSELIVRARGEAQRIRLFELKSRDAGVEKLALLIGDVIAQKSKGDLAFRLAEIYFHDLKDYEHAAQHYTVALDADVDAAKRPAARYYLARSYEVLAWKASLNKKENEYYTTQALTNYELLLRAFPVNEFRDAAVVALYTLRLQNTATLADVRSLSEGFLKEYPTLDGRESITLALGDAFRKLGGNADALPLYRSVLQSRKQSEAAEALFQLAMTMNEVGKADSAFGLLERFLSTHAQHPRRAHAAWMAGQFAAERGKTQQAIRAYEAVEREYSYSEHASQVPLARAEAYFAAGDLANAIDSYQQVLARIREDFFDLSEISPDVIFNLAHCYQRVGKRNEAKHHYADFLVRDQSSERRGDAYYALASIAREEQNLDLAARYLQEASHSSGGGSDQRLRAALEGADLLFRGESYGEALTRYREVAREAKVDTLLQYTLARIAVSYFRMNNAEEADKQAVSFLKTYPKARQYAAEFEFERGRYLLRRNEFDKAKTVLETVIKKYDDMPIAVDAQYWLGRVLEAVGRNQEARKTYETIIERKPGHPVALRARLSLGNILYSAEQWDPAARHYKAILDDEQKAPDLVPSAMNNLILAYKELGLFDGALELTRKYIERFPTDPQLVNKQIDIGVLYQKLGYYDQAVFHLQSLLNGADADTEAEVRYYIGEAFYYKGDHQQAILEFLKVPYLVTRRTKIDWVATSFYMAGQSYEKMSKFDQAISMYKQILERPNIDAQFKTAAQKEIDRVNALVRSQR